MTRKEGKVKRKCGKSFGILSLHKNYLLKILLLFLFPYLRFFSVETSSLLCVCGLLKQNSRDYFHCLTTIVHYPSGSWANKRRKAICAMYLANYFIRMSQQAISRWKSFLTPDQHRQRLRIWFWAINSAQRQKSPNLFHNFSVNWFNTNGTEGEENLFEQNVFR